MIRTFILIIPYILFLSPLICTCQSKKVNNFKAEIYEKKEIIEAYSVISIQNLNNETLKHLYNLSLKYTSDFADFLNEYFSNSYVKENFKLKKKFYHGFLYLKGIEYFDEYKRLVALEERINNILKSLINRDDELARISIYFDDNRYFSKSFEIIEGFEAIPDIDQFRILSSYRGRILNIEQGEEIVNNTEVYKFGYFENNISFQITIPLIVNNIYLADISFTFYKY